MTTDVVFRRQFRRFKSATSGNGKIYRQRVTKPDVVNEVDVSRFVAETAMQMNDRLVELSSFIRSALEEAIPELRGDARTIELLAPASREMSTPCCTRFVTTSRWNESRRRLRRWSMPAAWRNTVCRSTPWSGPIGWASAS